MIREDIEIVPAEEITLQQSGDTRALRNALGTFATGITVVTVCGAEGEWVGLTVNSFNSVSLGPPLVLWSLSLASPNCDAVRQATHFAVNVLAADQEEISQRFASKIADKFDGIACTLGDAGVPLLPGCCAWFECRTVARHPGGDHLILVGEVERFASEPGRAPLLYFGGAYRSLAGGSAG